MAWAQNDSWRGVSLSDRPMRDLNHCRSRVDERQQRDGRLTHVGREPGEIVQDPFGRRLQDLVALQRLEPPRFVRNRRRGLHRNRRTLPPAGPIRHGISTRLVGKRSQRASDAG